MAQWRLLFRVVVVGCDVCVCRSVYDIELSFGDGGNGLKAVAVLRTVALWWDRMGQ